MCSAEAKGFNRLANADEALGHYQGVVGATRRSWAKQNEKELTGYIRGHLAALDWLFDPANKAEAIAILRKHVPDMSEERRRAPTTFSCTRPRASPAVRCWMSKA